jgi:putative transposase
VFVTADRKNYFEARCADLRRPRISLWEQRHALKLMKEQGQRNASEALIFKTIEQQRQLIARAKVNTRAARRAGPKPGILLSAGTSAFGRAGEGEAPLDYSKPVDPYDAEVW